jgi:hypothetical protein
MRKSLLAIVLLAAAARGGEVALRKTFAVNEYFGIEYEKEPVSFDVTFPRPVAAEKIGLVSGGRAAARQIEVVEGTPAAVRKARVWTHVDFPFVEGAREVGKGKQRKTIAGRFPAPPDGRHKLFTVVGPVEARPAATSKVKVARGGAFGQIDLAEVSSGPFRAKVPVGSVTFEVPVAAFDVPGPVVSVSRDGERWIGTGYLDCMRRVAAVTCEVDHGPIYFESNITYTFEGGRRYVSRVRIYAARPYVQLVEDFDVGGAARFVFNYDDWFADAFFRPGDNRLVGWRPIQTDNPCGDFVRIEGQKALARLVIWSQFNYFGGKQETIALKAPDPAALAAACQGALRRYEQQAETYPKRLEQWGKSRRGRRPRPPARPEQPVYGETTYTLSGASMRAASVVTPGGDATAVGAFYVRPDRWTRAKVNHVDLYVRPEVPGDRMTRGVVGLKGARLRIAMEAWLVDGHREWAIFAVRAGDDDWLAKAHVREGVWPLDRIVRLPLVWNSDGSAVRPEHTRPGEGFAGGAAQAVLKGARGRSGLQYFNGSNGHIRWRPPTDGWDGAVIATGAETADVNAMVAGAMTCYTASDDSAYPSFRAMLPWTHPEAINPFYQGMENMNFNADLYRYVAGKAVPLLRTGQPDGARFLDHAEKSFDMALDRYVYPQSGCWEESHGYAGHTLGVVGPLAVLLANSGRRSFLEDARLARMMEFFLYVHSPIDAEFGRRVVPPVGDHGLSRDGPARRFGKSLKLFLGAKDPEVRRIVRQAAWMIAEDGGEAPEGITPQRPDLSSRWLQGYGTVMRAFDETPRALKLVLDKALIRPGGGGEPRPLTLLIPVAGDAYGPEVRGSSPTFNRAAHSGTLKVARAEGAVELHVDMTIGSDKWVRGGPARYRIRLQRDGRKAAGTFAGTFNGAEVAGRVAGELLGSESFLVLRAGQSWGHHHEDKGSMWFWGRNVHFFGDCSWGGPPGGTYWNKYKQGPASGTQIELVGVNNWTLPCKYPAPWISDDEYNAAAGYDYANARCLYPFNPKLDVSTSTPVARRNGYDRQVLFIHPDVLVVRDNVETVCPTIWRMHSYQPQSTTVSGGRATLASPQGVVGELAMVYPDGVNLRAIDRDMLNEKYFDDEGRPLPFEKLPRFRGSVELRWDMPANASATWVFAVRDKGAKPPSVERLDEHGRVTRMALGGGRHAVVLMNIEPFEYRAGGIEFRGTVGLVIREADGTMKAHPIRSTLRIAR